MGLDLLILSLFRHFCIPILRKRRARPEKEDDTVQISIWNVKRHELMERIKHVDLFYL